MSREQLLAIHDEFVAEFRGTTVSARIFERFKGRIITAILNNPALKDLAVELIESAFDKVIVPIDIPGLDDDQEKQAEAFARSMIRPMVEWALSKISSKGPNPPAPETTVPGFGFDH